ncbi:MAG: hypothetical protein KDD56_05005, partial [Bdellovibrionales bacterium]|nr:hypothetical protein [Bdellovibrionales bacterium]
LEVVLTKEIASCLYAGVAGDTGIFRWMHPKPEDFRDAAEFVAAGADPVLIATELYGRVTAEAINLKAEALSNLEYYLDKQVVFVTVTDEMCARHNANSKDGKDLVSMLRYIDGVLCSVYMRKEDNKWNVSFRSDANKLNVAEVASELGGGGHPAAAAFRRSGVEAEDLKKEIISIIKSKLKK